MGTDTSELGRDFCRILMLTDDWDTETDTGAETTAAQNGSPLDSKTCVNGPLRAGKEVSGSFSPDLADIDIEMGVTDVSKMNQDTCGSLKTEISLTKPLRRQNSLQTGESIPPLMNHILMFLKFDAKEKQGIERTHDATYNRWRKYKRPSLFDSRRVVILFSILSSMGSLVLIYLTLRVRQVSDGYIHG